MGQVATLTRINKETFETVKSSKQFPSSFEEQVDVDKYWEAIMYILGDGFIGKEPTISLFMPDHIIIQYEDEYMKEGIRYHDQAEIKKMKAALDKFQGDQTIHTINIEKMNQQMIYKVRMEDLEIIQSKIEDIKNMFDNALKYNSIIIGDIG